LDQGGDDAALQSYGQPQDEEEEAQIIEDAICPPDDEVENALAHIIGLEAVKNQIRGLRRTLEMEGDSNKGPRHMVFVGNPGTGKSTVARILAPLLYNIGAVKSPMFVEAGREDLIDHRGEAKTVFKTRKLMQKAQGGVLFIDEAYTLLPSTARPRGRDHGAAALRELARSLPTGNPLVILTGTHPDLQRILGSDIGFKGNFLTRIEFPDPTPSQIARMFMAKLNQKGLVPGVGLTVDFLAELIENNTDEDWRLDRNGRMSDLLLEGVRTEMRKRAIGNDEHSRHSVSPIKMMSTPSQRMPAYTPEEVFVTVEDVQNAFVNGM
jgi:SpoVK/Ycf46/Vps4 family AAA+-type ATPase